MIQGTTPTITISLPFGVSELEEAEFTMADYESVVRQWYLNEMEADGSILKIRLTQDDTLTLKPKIYKVQLRVKVNGGAVFATKISSMSISELLSGNVI